ncbi:condensation domain-containing protein [Acrocarpospora catenulata]|uniref:condensation domain-containing protein n=1 Tax=Acrocarpospora catenulata TaxID=2836182 RepID=UPI001BD91E75|nr:condensation domain-containing protein [Acrocarpospora catenulata]
MYAEFGGGRAGQGPLTWGQQGIWEAMGRNPPGHFNIGRVLMVPRRGGVEAVEAARAVGRLVERHEALRTRVVVTGEPRQVVSAAGRIPLRVVEAEPGGDTAAEMLAEIAAEEFDHAVEWPIRVGLVTSGGRVRWVVLVLSHLAADGHATEIVVRDMRRLLRQGSIGGPSPAQPLDLAYDQRARGARRTSGAVAFWTGQYERLPPATFTPDYPGRGHRRLRLTSETLAVAVDRLAARHQVSSSTVLLAATAALVGARTGNAAVALSTVVGNRFSNGLREMVTTLDQLGLFVLDLDGGPSLDELVPRAWRAALTAYRHAYYEQPELDRALARLGEDRGAELNPYGCFNDVRRAASAPKPSPNVPKATDTQNVHNGSADKNSRLDRLPAPEGLRCRFCLLVLDHEEDTGAVVLQLTADTRCLPPEQVEGFLPELENLVLAAA